MATRNLELSIQSVATATGQFERVGRNDERHQLVQVIVEGALQLHERKDCKRSLIQTAREIVIGLRAARHSSLWKLGRRDSNELPEMPDYVDKFLRRIRSDFPTILLDATEGEAFVIREHWAKGDQNATVHSWSSAKVLGVVHLNQHIINCMISCKAKHPDMFHAFMFQMIISTAHEICHLLTSALTGGSDPPKTPERLKLDDSQGEAGFYWELYALGGVTLFFVDPGRPNDIQQAGIPWMLDGKGSKAHGIQVQQAVMNNFVRNISSVSLPLYPKGFATLPNTMPRDIIFKNTLGLMSDFRKQMLSVPGARHRLINMPPRHIANAAPTYGSSKSPSQQTPSHRSTQTQSPASPHVRNGYSQRPQVQPQYQQQRVQYREGRQYPQPQHHQSRLQLPAREAQRLERPNVPSVRR